MVETNGKAQVDFADTVDQSRVKVRNLVDSISEWVGKHADLGVMAQAITGVSGSITLASQAAGPLKTAFTSLLPLVGTAGLSGAFTGLTTMLSGTVMPLISTAIPLALKGLAALFTMPAGLVVAGVMAGVAVWKNWDTIGPIVQRTYEGVKTWMVDKFAAIVESIRQKVRAVTGFFADMYDKVVGNSYVPDMVNEIGVEFDSLDGRMVRPAGNATNLVQSAFRSMSDSVQSLVGNMLSRVSSLMTGWLDRFLPSWASNIVGGIASTAMSGLVGKIPVVGSLLGGSSMLPGILGGTAAAGTAAGATAGAAGAASAAGAAGGGSALGFLANPAFWTNPWTIGIGAAIGGAFLLKKLFGGPSEQEKEGREVATNFRVGLEEGLSQAQLAEAAGIDGIVSENEKWKLSVIAIRDAYIAAGKTEAEALAAANALWAAEKKGGAEVQKVIEEINAAFKKNAEVAKQSSSDIARWFSNSVMNQKQQLRSLLLDNERTWEEIRNDAINALNAIPDTIPIDIVYNQGALPPPPTSVTAPADGGASAPTPDPSPDPYTGPYSDPYAQQYYHRGGMVRRAHTGMYVPRLRFDEVPIIAQTEEGILNRQATRAIGGEAGVNALNNGGSLRGGAVINIQTLTVVANSPMELKRQLVDMLRRNYDGLLSETRTLVTA
jgi:hypothetical protein